MNTSKLSSVSPIQLLSVFRRAKMSENEQFNSDEIEPPSFLTQEYFHRILKDILKDPNLEVRNSSLYVLSRNFKTKNLPPTAPLLFCRTWFERLRSLCECHPKGLCHLQEQRRGRP